PKPAEAALMVSEQFTQYIQADLHMATFWPLSWPSSSFRALFNQRADYNPQKMYDMFMLFKDVLGQNRLNSSGSMETVLNLAVKSENGKTVWVYLINKDQLAATREIDLQIPGFNAQSIHAEAFSAEENSMGTLKLTHPEIKKNKGTYSLSMPLNSFLKITLKAA